VTLREILARLVRLQDAMHDEETAFVWQVLDDLIAEVWDAIESEEQAA
jgi:hypothetical protein